MISQYKRELSVALAYLFLLLILALFAPSFYKSGETREILVQSAPVLIAAIGMTLVILARHIDISIGSQFAICGIMAGLLAKAGLPVPLVVLGGVCCRGGMGAVVAQRHCRFGAAVHCGDAGDHVDLAGTNLGAKELMGGCQRISNGSE